MLQGESTVRSVWHSVARNVLDKMYAQRGTLLYARDFALPFGFLFVRRGFEKTTKLAVTLDLYIRIWNFNRLCVLKIILVTQLFGIELWAKQQKKKKKKKKKK